MDVSLSLTILVSRFVSHLFSCSCILSRTLLTPPLAKTKVFLTPFFLFFLSSFLHFFISLFLPSFLPFLLSSFLQAFGNLWKTLLASFTGTDLLERCTMHNAQCTTHNAQRTALLSAQRRRAQTKCGSLFWQQMSHSRGRRLKHALSTAQCTQSLLRRY